MKKKCIRIIIMFIVLIASMSIISNGTGLDVDKININTKYMNEFDEQGNKLLGIIQVVGVVCSVIALVIIGIKYMISSAAERADEKKTLWFYFIGTCMAFGAISLTSIIYNLIVEVMYRN